MSESDAQLIYQRNYTLLLSRVGEFGLRIAEISALNGAFLYLTLKIEHPATWVAMLSLSLFSGLYVTGRVLAAVTEYHQRSKLTGRSKPLAFTLVLTCAVLLIIAIGVTVIGSGAALAMAQEADQSSSSSACRRQPQ